MPREYGLDEEYLSDIAGLEEGNVTDGGSDGGQPSGDVNQSTGGEPQQTGGEDPAPQPVEPQQTAQPPQSEQPQQTPQAAPVAGLRRHISGNYVNEQGDIVRQDGVVIAPRGASRRMYEEAGRIRQQHSQLQERYSQLENQVRQTQFLNGVPQQLGLSNEEVASALDLQARIKRGDALGVAKDVVAMLAAKGHNITDLFGGEVGDSVDMRAINRMLDERLGPIQRQEQADRAQQEAERVAKENYNRFVGDNPGADVQGEIIVQFARMNGVSLQQAYNHVSAFALRNNLDMSQPLGPQIEAVRARAAAQRQQPQPQPRGNPPNGRPMPNGAPTRANGVEQMQPVYASPDDDWGTILHQVMQESRQ